MADVLPKIGEDVTSLMSGGAVPSVSTPDLHTLVTSSAQAAGLDPDFVTRLVSAESNWNPGAVSNKGAQGLMQLMPDTAKQYGVTNPMDPAQNVKGGIAYLKDLTAKYPDRPDLVAAAYNAGPGAVDKAGGVPNFSETQAYVQKVAPDAAGANQTPRVGEDVTALMGESVTPPRDVMPLPPTVPAGMLQKLAAAAAPTIGGIVGGTFGGVPGAALGGAAGQGYGEVVRHATEIPGAIADVARNLITQPAATLSGAAEGATEGLKNAGIEAGTMAAGQAIGSTIISAAGSLGKIAMEKALAPTTTLAREFPELSQTMIDNAITVSQGGLNKARTLLRAAKATANSALDAAHAAGATVPITAATDGLLNTYDHIAVNSSDPIGALNKLASLANKMTAGRPADLTMREADALKTGLQNEVKALYKSLAAGNGSRGLAIEANAKADMAQSLNQAIENAATNVGVTGYKAANAAAQDLIGVVRAVSRRVLQPGASISGALGEAVTPAAVGGAFAGPAGAAGAAAARLSVRAATSPAALSRVALLANQLATHPLLKQALQQLPKPALDAIRAAIGFGEPQ